MISNRLRKLRNELNLSQQAFGQSLGVSRDVISNIEQGRVELRDHIVKLICSEFNVNEEWLRDGKGEMFNPEERFSLDKFAKQRQISELELDILKAYFELDPETRQHLLKHFKERFTSSNTSKKVEQPLQEEKRVMSVEAAEEAYIKSRPISAQKTILSSLNSTDEIKNQKQVK